MYSNWSSSSSEKEEKEDFNGFPIPENYKFIHILGEGGFGIVIKCIKEGTNKTVAVKVNKMPKYDFTPREARIMKTLMEHNLDRSNIVKYEGTISKRFQTSLVFEMLDINLDDYIADVHGQMRLEEVRTIIQQMAVAFDALKSVGIIHGDVKKNNIMMVDHVRQPLKVKLIDFGIAIFKSEAKPGTILQTPQIRAPEIILQLPFSEAIDIWSLGCIMASMVFGVTLFPGSTNYILLRFMTDLLGPPPKDLLNAGLISDRFYKKIDGDEWLLKTLEEYYNTLNWGSFFTDKRRYTFRSLDEMKTMWVERDNVREADERRECIELLKAMLQWDEKDRITPRGILNHPFITKSYLNSPSNLSPCDEPEPTTSQDQTGHDTPVEDSSEALPPGVILVRPADPENRIHLRSSPQEDSDLSSHSSAATAYTDTTTIYLDSEFTVTSSNDSEDWMMKKKKKNPFQRFFSWMKRTFSCSVDTVED